LAIPQAVGHTVATTTFSSLGTASTVVNTSSNIATNSSLRSLGLRTDAKRCFASFTFLIGITAHM
jgi:hypothetical protein